MDERTTVKTYVPAHQKGEWREHADELGMSLSEFVRTMVQAGRRGFDGETGEEPARTDATPGVEGVEGRILDVLDEDGPLAYDELRERVLGEFDDTVDELQASDRVRYDGRAGGFVRVE
jgi:hypothetical protein